jgi:hypothetical protein
MNLWVILAKGNSQRLSEQLSKALTILGAFTICGNLHKHLSAEQVSTPHVASSQLCQQSLEVCCSIGYCGVEQNRD